MQSWDPAIVDNETAAFTVCTTWGILGKKLYLLDVFRKRLEFHNIEPAILLKDKHRASCVVLEVSGVGMALGNSLVKREGARRRLCPIDPNLGKVERCANAEDRAQARLFARRGALARNLRGGSGGLSDVQIRRSGRFHGAFPDFHGSPNAMDHRPCRLSAFSRAAVLIAGGSMEGRWRRGAG